MLSTISEHFNASPEGLNRTTQRVLSALGFMVVVPSNPEDQYFQIAEGMIQLIKQHDWAEDKHFLMRCRIYAGIIRYLTA